MTYERVVTAALAETRSKFALAEALALEIPPRRGRTATDETSTAEYLAQAREAIIAAGGEPRDVTTLRDYRQTALWVMEVDSLSFRWLPQASFSAHAEARKNSMTYEQFAALPRKTMRDVRRETGHPVPSGWEPERVIPDWTPQQKTEAARQLASEPQVAQQMREELVSTPESAEQTYQAARDAKIKQARSQMPPPPPKTDQKRERVIRIERVADELIGKLADVLDPDLDRNGQTLTFLAQNLDALSDSYRQRLARAVKELSARASEWEDRMLGIADHTVTAQHEGEAR